jgi:hypothetical protein
MIFILKDKKGAHVDYQLLAKRSPFFRRLGQDFRDGK